MARVVRGASPRPISNFITADPNGIHWIKIGDVETGAKHITRTAEKITAQGAEKSRSLKKGDFILSNSMSFGRPFILAIDGCIHDGWIAMSGFEDSYNPDFLYHLLRSSGIQQYWQQSVPIGTIRNLNADIVRSTPVPVPTLVEQARIVGLLDRFDALTNDLTHGLPAEISARKRQYEYYRDKLLDFTVRIMKTPLEYHADCGLSGTQGIWLTW